MESIIKKFFVTFSPKIYNSSEYSQAIFYCRITKIIFNYQLRIIKRLIRKRERFYRRARKSSCPDLMNNYKKFRAHVQKVIRDAYWRHVSNIFTLEENETDPDSPKKNIKVKRFWSFVKSLKKEASGITSLRENGILKTDTVEKANICNRQFQSAFTREADTEIPLKGARPFSSMEEITVDPVGPQNC